MMHGADWNGEDLAGWLIAEKFNGCRVYWDGARMWTRNGNVVRIPADWASMLPAAHLDGELWAGRDGFQIARLATQYGKFTPGVRFMVFDANVHGDFAERQKFVRQVLEDLRMAAPVEHRRCRSTRDALQLLRDVQRAGGEGLIARHPGNCYRPGRTCQILKLKSDIHEPFHKFAEHTER